MKERGILFSPPMVQSILANRKLQTRRLVKFKTEINHDNLSHIGELINHKNGKRWAKFKHKISSVHEIDVFCPYGKVGDILYVKETWQMTGWDFAENEITVKYYDGAQHTHESPDDDFYIWLTEQVDQLERKGIITQSEIDEEMMVFTDKKQPWKPSMFMPKVAARIWLEITNVSVERLNDITEEDARLEGVHFQQEQDLGVESYKLYGLSDELRTSSPKISFETLWDFINGEGSWNENPWVWVIEFKVLSTTGRENLNA
jgi:hypothetical protein